MVPSRPDALTDIRPSRYKLRVLVPGAGLCRLAWDVANLGAVLRTIYNDLQR